jgi:hypothetical protein
VSAIDSVAKGHISVALTGIDIPTRQEFSEGQNIDQEAMSAVKSIETYGRNRCREMVNKPLLFVTSYNPNTDTGWPV